MGCASSTHAPSSENGFFDCYTLGVKLGRGAYGQVHIATPVSASKKSVAKDNLAVKILDLRDKDGNFSNDRQKSAATEADVWSTVGDHANVVRLQCVFSDDAFCYILMEKCASGLFPHLVNLPELNERSIGNILLQMLFGLKHVHSAEVVHRDVKPDNFLVGGNDGTKVKLCDFGLSARLPSLGNLGSTSGETKGKLKGMYGTAPFVCPEMIKGRCYDARADAWSLGVLSYTLLFGTFPYLPEFPDSALMRHAIAEGRPPTFEPVAPCIGHRRSDSAVEFVKALLERSPDRRSTVFDALRMPYMVAVSENRHMNEIELPSLRPMLWTARKVGAFQICDASKAADIDPLLKKKQLLVQHGKSLLEHTSEKTSLGTEPRCPPREGPKSYFWQTGKSKMSLNSKAEETSSTSASGNSSSHGSVGTSECSSAVSRSRAESGWSQMA